MKRLWLFALAGALFAGNACSSSDEVIPGKEEEPWQEDDPSDDPSGSTFDKQVVIEWDGSTVDVASTVDALRITRQQGHVVVDAATASVEGVELVLRGASDDGSLKIYADKKMRLTLDGVELRSASGAAINNQSKKRTFVRLSPGTRNILGDGAVYDDLLAGEDCKGAFFSEGQLVFHGTGALEVSSRSKHAIACDEYVRIYEGTIEVPQAGKDGLHVNDYVRLDGGTLSVTAASDGIDCERGFIHLVAGSVRIVSGGDGLKASGKVASEYESYVEISGGQHEIVCSGQKSKGIDALQKIEVSGGRLTVEVSGAAGRGLRSEGEIYLAGGTVVVDVTGDGLYEAGDVTGAACLRADGAVVVSGATLTANATGDGGKGVRAGSMRMTAGEVALRTTGVKYESNGASTAPKGIRTDGEVNLTGGRMWVRSDNDDALHATGTIAVHAGTLLAVGAPDGYSLRTDAGLAIGGGSVAGIGGNAATTLAAATTRQRLLVARRLEFADRASLALLAHDGALIMGCTLPYTGDEGVLLFSSPSLVSGDYTLSTGGTFSGGETWNGFVSNATYAGGERQLAFTVSGELTEVSR